MSKEYMKKMLVFGFLLLHVVGAQAMHVPIDDVEEMNLEPENKAALLEDLEEYIVIDDDLWLGFDGKRNYAQEVIDAMAQHAVDFENEPVLKRWLEQAFDCHCQNVIVCLQEAGVEVN